VVVLSRTRSGLALRRVRRAERPPTVAGCSDVGARRPTSAGTRWWKFRWFRWVFDLVDRGARLDRAARSGFMRRWLWCASSRSIRWPTGAAPAHLLNALYQQGW